MGYRVFLANLAKNFRMCKGAAKAATPETKLRDGAATARRQKKRGPAEADPHRMKFRAKQISR